MTTHQIGYLAPLVLIALVAVIARIARTMRSQREEFEGPWSTPPKRMPPELKFPNRAVFPRETARFDDGK